MNRHVGSRLVSAVLVAGTVACVDSPAAPVAAPVPEGAPNAMVVIDEMAPDSTSATFTVTPSGGIFSMGSHHVYFPARSICDPATSMYGPAHWDEPCQPVSQPVTITAEVRTTDGVPWVFFSPNLRFVPSAYPTRWVWLYMETRGAWDSLEPDRFTILWFSETGAEPVDESLSDPTLKTYVWPAAGLVYRRIKHFSGYQVHDGRTTTTEADSTLAF